MKPTNTNTPPKLFVAVEVADRHIGKEMFTINNSGDQHCGYIHYKNGAFHCESEDTLLEYITHVLEPLTPSTDTIGQEAHDFLRAKKTGEDVKFDGLYTAMKSLLEEFATSPRSRGVLVGEGKAN